MIHIGSHLAEGSCNGFQPDFWVIEHMSGNDLLSKDDYTWAMQHARKPKFEDLVHEKVERKRNTLQKEDRQRRREKQKGKGRSARNYSIRVGEHKQRHVVVIEQDGQVVSCPDSTSVKEHDYRLDCTPGFQIEEKEVPRTQDEDDLLAIALQREISQDNSTIDSISSSEETDAEEEINCFVPPPYAVINAVQRDRQNLPSMTPVQIRKADQLMEEFLLKFRVDWQNTSLRKDAPSSSSGKTSKSDHGTHSESSKERKGKKRCRDNDQDESADDGNGERLRDSQKTSTTRDSAEVSLLFACPYRKRNPKKYSVLSWGPCALTGHASIARVKLVAYFPLQLQLLTNAAFIEVIYIDTT
jgi:hypothetical protein